MQVCSSIPPFFPRGGGADIATHHVDKWLELCGTCMLCVGRAHTELKRGPKKKHSLRGEHCAVYQWQCLPCQFPALICKAHTLGHWEEQGTPRVRPSSS